MTLKRTNVLITDAMVVMALPARGRFIRPPQLVIWARAMNIHLSMSQASNMLSRARGLVVPTEHGWTLTLTGAAYRDVVADTLRRLTAAPTEPLTPDGSRCINQPTSPEGDGTPVERSLTHDDNQTGG